MDHEAPYPKDMLSATASKFFLSLKSDPQEVGSYRKIVLLSPYLEVEIMVDPSSLASDLVLIVLSTSTNMKSKLEYTEGFNVQEHDSATACVLFFL